MEMQRPDFLMKVYSTSWGIFTSLNQILNADLKIARNSGKYEGCDVAIYEQDFFDPTKPVDFDNDNYLFDLYVTYDGEISFEEACVNQVELARKFKTTFELLGCVVDVSFYFMLPDGKNPNRLFDPDIRLGEPPPNLTQED